LGSLSAAVLGKTELWLATKKRIFVYRIRLEVIGVPVLWIDEFIGIEESFCILIDNNHLAELIIVKVIIYFTILVELFLL
jgi:hypothetical protein